MNNEEEWLMIGKIVAAKGLKGEIRLNPSSDFAERFTVPGTRWLQKKSELPRPITLIAGHQIPGKSIFIISLANITNRNAAESLIGEKMLVPANNRPKMRENEFHLLDLLGLNVKLTKNGEPIGKVINLTSAGNDLLEIKLLEGKQVLIPFVKEIVPEVKIKEGWIMICPPPGLLEI